MSIFSDNIRFLRVKKNLSQQGFAEILAVSRDRYAKYESGRSEAPYELLVKISKYYKISIDLLLTVDVRKYPLDNMIELPENRILLPIQVDGMGDNKIEIVPHKAKMGYLEGYDNAGYIESLQNMSLPFLRNGKFRAFPVEGESMPPYNDGSYLLGKYVESKDYLKSGRSYIFITKEGIVYKRFEKQNKKGTSVISDNVFYQPYEIEWDDVLEIWEFAGSVNTKELQIPKSDSSEIRQILLELKNEIKSLKSNS